MIKNLNKKEIAAVCRIQEQMEYMKEHNVSEETERDTVNLQICILMSINQNNR